MCEQTLAQRACKAYDSYMDKTKRPVGRPPTYPTDEQVDRFLGDLKERYTLAQCMKRAGITQRQLDRMRKASEYIDFEVRLRMKYHRRLSLKGGDAALHRVIEEECQTSPARWRTWAEIEADLKKYRSMVAEAPLWANTDEPAPIPPDPLGMF